MNKTEKNYYASSINEFIEKIEFLKRASSKDGRISQRLYNLFAANQQYFIGRGSFRTVFSFDDDFIVKCANPDYNIQEGLAINEAEFQEINKLKYPDIVPKIYKYDTKYFFWSIQEKINRVIKHEDEFLDFFPNFVECLDIAGNKFGVPVDLTTTAVYGTLRDVMFLMDKYDIHEPEKMIQTGFYITDPHKTSHTSVTRESHHQWLNVLTEDLSKEAFEATRYFLRLYFKNLDTPLYKIYYNALTLKHKKLQAAIWDVRTENVGVDSDGNFKLLDTGFGL